MATALELQHFAVLEVAYLHQPTSIVITSTTNNPCHLTCYYTDKEPVRHSTTLIKRGVALPWGAYFCFVAWNSIEQQEAGDTLAHTFEVPDWSYCQRKWFTFRGTVATALSPSVTALLQHHHPGIFTTRNTRLWYQAYYQVFRSANPGDPDVLYALAHSQEQADSYFTGIPLYGQRVRVVGTYAAARIRRLAFLFNTRGMTPCTLLTATLRVVIRKLGPPPGYSANWDWYVKLRAGQDLNAQITHGDLVNYSKILSLGTEIASKYADDLPDPGFLEYWYIPVPLSFINLDGFTVFTSLTSKDETATRPANNTVEEPLFVDFTYAKLIIEYYQH